MNLATLQADIASVATRVEHAVAWLLGMATLAEQDVATLEADSPLVKDAIIAGEAAASAHGVPVGAIIAGAEEVLAMAQEVAAGTASSSAAAKAVPVGGGVAGAVKAGLAVLVLAGTLALSACAKPPSPLAVVDAAQTAYQLLAKDEKAAIDAGLISPATAVTVRQTDTTLYAGLVAWRTAAESGQTVAVTAELAVEGALKGLVAQLTTAKAISPAAGAAASDAIALLAQLTGV